MSQINLESGTGLSTPLLIADPVATPGGSNDSTGELTEVDGETASIALEIQSLLGAVLLPRVTTAIMNDFTAVNGMIIYNLTAQAFYGYINGAWSPLAYIGPDIGLSQGANIVLTPNPITSSGTIALSTTLINLNSVQVGNITLSGSDINSTGSLVFGTNGSTTALTLDTSQNATFAGSINVPLNINLTSSSNLNGLFSSTASSASGGVYFDAIYGNLRFSGGSSSNVWSFYSSGSSQLFYIFNNPSATNTIGISNGSLVLQSTGGASLISAPTSMSGNYAYLWPPAYPSNNGYILSSNTAGVMTWIANEETEGGENELAYFNSSGDLASNSNVSVESNGDIDTNGTLTAGNITLTSSTIESSATLILATNGSTTALTLDTSQNAFFDGNVNLDGSNSIILGSNYSGITTYVPFINLYSSSSDYLNIAMVSGGTAAQIEAVGVPLYLYGAAGGIFLQDAVTCASTFALTSSGGGFIIQKAPNISGTFTYTWPPAYPPSNGYIMACSTAGVMTWIANEETEGSANTLAYFNSSSDLAPNTNVTVDSAGNITANSNITLGATGGASYTLSFNNGTNSSYIDYQGGSVFSMYSAGVLNLSADTNMTFYTNNGSLALTLDTSQNATFTGVVKLINNNSLILGSNATSGSGLQPYISIMENTGNYITMGPNYASGNNLIASVSSTLPFQINSGTSLIFGTNGSTTALTLDTSQNATFVGNINAPLNINLTTSSNLNGLFSSAASSAGGGVYFDASAGNLRFSGGSDSNYWGIYDSGENLAFRVYNNGATAALTVNNGTLESTASLILATDSSTTALTLDTSQNATFVGYIRIQNNAGLLLNNPSNSYATTLIAGSTSANLTYTLPTAYPPSNGYIMACTTGGVMSWIANEETEGSPNVLAYFNSSSDLAPNTNVTVDSSGDIVTSGTFQSNGITSNSNVNVNANLQIGESSAGNTYTLYFDNGTLNNYIVYNSGNLEIASAGTLTTSTVGDTYFYTNSGGLALTLDTSQNATFNKSVTVEGYILAQFPIIFNAAGLGGLYSYYANNGTGGTYIEPNYGFIEFKGGTGANTWGVIDSNGYTCLEVTNVGSGGTVILNNGNVTVQNGNSFYLGGSTGFVGLNSPNVSISSYNITFPAAAPSNAGFLNVPNSGTANWVTGRAFYQSSTTQAISGSTQTAVQFNNPIYNYGGVITASGTGNSVFTNSTSSTIYVHFIYNLFWAGISVGGYNFEAYMLIGSGTIQYAQSLITSSNNQIILAGSGIVELTAGESFSIYVNNNQSNTYNLDGSATNKVVSLQMWQLA
jgi:hypothetical protein